MTKLNDKFWNDQLSDRTRAIVVKGVHYRIGSTPYPKRGLGFGGSHWKIRMHATNEIIDTCDLWHQGTIPEEYRQVLPDNASFQKTIEVQYIES